MPDTIAADWGVSARAAALHRSALVRGILGGNFIRLAETVWR